MAYIGRQLVRGQNRVLDDISGSFNGSTTAFNLTVSSSSSPPASVNQLWIILGGILQKPGTDFTVADAVITFTTAPASTLSFWGMIQGDTSDINSPADASVTPSKIANSGDFAFPADVRFNDADGSHYVGLQAPSTVSSNLVWTLPAADGSANQLLKTDGSGNLGWASDTQSNLLDEDNMSSNSATQPASQQSIKAYVDAGDLSLIDEDNMSTNSATRPPSQQSVKAYVDAGDLSLIDEDNMSTDSATRPPSQQSVKAYADTKAVLTGSTNNTITTVTGANAIQGEANLTFDGTHLLASGSDATTTANAGGTGIQIKNTNSTNNNQNYLAFYDSTGTSSAAIIAQHENHSSTTGNLQFGTRNAGSFNEAMRIDSSRRVLVGTTTEGHGDADNLTINDTRTGITIRSANDNYGNIFFSDGTSGAGEYAGYIQYSHQHNTILFGTNSTDEIRIQNGGGISFNGDTAAANALNDYEEGTWTPTVFGGTTAGTYSYEAVRTGGKYTKIGNLVYIEAVLRISSITSAGAGTLNFGGLPFGFGANPASSWNPGTGIQITHYAAGSNSSVGDYPPPFVAIGNPSATTFVVYSYGKNYSVASVIGDLSAANWIYQIAGCYQV